MKKFKYFTIAEFERSSVAKERGIDNAIPLFLLDKAYYTLQCLDEIREGYGKPIIITSGYRCPLLNSAVGGVSNSQHTKCEAADLRWDEGLLAYILDNCDYDQLIEEKVKNVKWIHISFRENNNRKQYIQIKK